MPQPIAFLQKSLLTARAADRRRQTSRNLTDTGQCWKNADDGVQEIFVESVAQFVAAVESLDMQSHGKWGRCVFLQFSTRSSTVRPVRSVRQLLSCRLIRSGYVFRGLPNCTWQLLTSLMRCGNSHDHARKVELPIARSFQRCIIRPHPHLSRAFTHGCRYTSAGSVTLPQPCSSNIWGLLAYMQVCLMRHLLLLLLRYTVFTRPCLAAPRVAHSPAGLDVLCPRRASLCHHRKRTHGG